MKISSVQNNMNINKSQNQKDVSFNAVIPVKVYSILPERPDRFSCSRLHENITKGIGCLIRVLEKRTETDELPRQDIIKSFAEKVWDYSEPICNTEGQSLIRHSGKHSVTPYLFTGHLAEDLNTLGKCNGGAKSVKNKDLVNQRGREYEETVLKFIGDLIKRLEIDKKPVELHIYTVSDRLAPEKYKQTLLDIEFRDLNSNADSIQNVMQNLINKGIEISGFKPKGQLLLFA